MSRLCTIIPLAFLAVLPAQAEDAAELVPRCGGPFALCGYVDKATREERIPRRFEVAQPFSDGLAAVRVNGLYGFINAAGTMVIAPRFQNAGPFAGEYAEVRLDGSTGIVNRSGKIVVAPQFRRIIPFTEDVFIAKPFVHVAGYPREVLRNDRPLESITDPLSLSTYNDSGLYHVKKGWLSAQNLHFKLFDKPERGLIWADNRSSTYNKTWGLLRADGSWQVKPSYDDVHQLRNGHAAVQSFPDLALPMPQRRQVQRWGAVDHDGKLIVPLAFYSPRAALDEAGRAMYAQPLKADVAPTEQLAAEKPDTEKLLFACPGGLTVVQRGESVEFRKSKEGPVIGAFDKGYFQASDCHKGIAATRNRKWFVVLEGGTVIGGENGYEDLSASFGNHWGVKVGGKWGVIDRSGTFTVKPRFASMRMTPEDTYAVNEGGDTYWIDAAGERVAKPTKEWGPPPPKRSLACGGGLRFFQKGDLWGLQDSDGKTVIEPKYPALSCFRNGVAWVALLNPTQWCPIGPDGNRIEAMECKSEYYFQTWSHSRPENLASGQYDVSIAWNRAWLDYHAGKRDKLPEWITMGYGYVHGSKFSK
ncbi:MAG TPA: WG repeat-containing protein [Rhodocyclaceae bacterium]|nr:WG repeat-containing protein [Rhodocyclaceae bacterium]